MKARADPAHGKGAERKLNRAREREGKELEEGDFYRSRQYIARKDFLRTYQPGQGRREFHLLIERAHRRWDD